MTLNDAWNNLLCISRISGMQIQVGSKVTIETPEISTYNSSSGSPG